MKQRTALTLAIALTAFVIIAAASIFVAMPSLRTAEAASALPASAVMDPTDVPALLDTVQSREAAYNAQIEQANTQLKAAYEQIQQLQAANQQLQQREQVYQQRLEQSNQVIESMQATPFFASSHGDEHEAYESHQHETHESHHDDD